MSTVFDYLEKIKQENPEHKYTDNVSLYQELREQDSNMPAWHTMDNIHTKATNR